MSARARGGRFVAGVVAVVVLLAGCTTGVVLHLRRDSDNRAASRRADATVRGEAAAAGLAQARDSELQKLLDRHAAAVLAHDQQAFLADIDPAASEFRTRQEAIFRGLRRVPFQAFGYRLVPNRTYTVRAITQRWGPTAYVAAVVATHRLRGFDTGDAAEAMAFTVVHRDQGWALVADDEVDGSLPAQAHSAPWDVGEVSVAQGKHSVVIGDVRDRATLPAVARRADAAAAAVGKVWPAGAGRWPGSVVVYSARNQKVMSTYLSGTQDPAARPAALAVPVLDGFSWFDSLTKAPKQVGMRVVVDGAASKAEDDELLRHEVTHVATTAIEGTGTPTWLVEGIAEYTAWHLTGLRDALVRYGVDETSHQALEKHRYTFTLPYSVQFYDDADTVDGNYTAGTLACAYVRERWGQKTLFRLHAKLSRSVDPLDEADSQDKVFRSVLGISRAQFERDAGKAIQQRWFG
ncbi:hypothetical protein ACPPVT_09445 [Angustibacter sp. McL0619]|uniref:hypothetical protein n=1 Tax=Angustibacter sp. McL0619 TaxID=3415676 RepID=UPI003CEE4402